MNVSLLPLQERPYKNSKTATDKIGVLWHAFGEIRGEWPGNALRFDHVSNEVYGVVLDDLAFRVEQIRGQCQNALFLVPFGNVARRAIERTTISSDSALCIYELERVPHPASCKWKNEYQKERLAGSIDAWLRRSMS